MKLSASAYWKPAPQQNEKSKEATREKTFPLNFITGEGFVVTFLPLLLPQNFNVSQIIFVSCVPTLTKCWIRCNWNHQMYTRGKPIWVFQPNSPMLQLMLYGSAHKYNQTDFVGTCTIGFVPLCITQNRHHLFSIWTVGNFSPEQHQHHQQKTRKKNQVSRRKKVNHKI